MKNLYLIPTDKPSSLSIIDSQLIFSNQYFINPQHIYITSNEEINQQTKPCWCINTIKNTWNIDLIYYQGLMPQYHYIGFKKIILTTDQDLIKDGIQAIDDEFLTWFVKNSSCEEVEVNQFNNECMGECGICDNSCGKYYKIVIPKEETTKQEYKPNSCDEIFEKAAETYVNNDLDLYESLTDGHISYDISIDLLHKLFIAGAKWKQERMYSEEDMKLAFEAGYKKGLSGYPNTENWKELSFDEWFEQFKKK